MLNKVMLIGRLGADPEVRYMPSGDAITTIRLATDRTWKDRQTGERKQETEWHRVVFFNQGNYKLAEIAGQYLKKGSLVYVEGRIRTQKWQDKTTGQDRFSTEIMADDMRMLESKGGGSTGYSDNAPPVSSYENMAPPPPRVAPSAPVAGGNAPGMMPPAAPAPVANYDDFDDDIPF